MEEKVRFAAEADRVERSVFMIDIDEEEDALADMMIGVGSSVTR